MSAWRCILAFTWAHCWNTTFSNSAWERIKEKSGSSLCTKFCHPLTLHPPLRISYFHQILRQRLCDFLILVPLLSLSFLSVSETKVLWLSLALCVSLSPSIPFISLFCSPWQFRHMPKPVLSLGTLQWAGLPLHLSPQCEQHKATSSAVIFINLLCSCDNCIYRRRSL